MNIKPQQLEIFAASQLAESLGESERLMEAILIYCKSLKAAERVMQSITRFLTGKLKLKVNQDKSAVSRPWLRKFFS